MDTENWLLLLKRQLGTSLQQQCLKIECSLQSNLSGGVFFWRRQMHFCSSSILRSLAQRSFSLALAASCFYCISKEATFFFLSLLRLLSYVFVPLHFCPLPLLRFLSFLCDAVVRYKLCNVLLKCTFFYNSE